MTTAGDSFMESIIPKPAPAPRFSRTALPGPCPPEHPGTDTAGALAGWGLHETDIARLRDAGTLV